MMRRCVVGCSLLLLLVLSPSWRAAAAIRPGALVRDIEIRGNRRTPEATIRFYFKTEGGKPYVPQTLSEDIKRLYALRTFDDIQVLTEDVPDGIRLIITVVEKPAVRNVTFEGNWYIDAAEIRKRILLQERSTFARNLLNNTVTALQKYYQEEGYYFAHISPDVTEVADNQVDILLRITEGKKIYISRIRFTGTKGFTDSALRNAVQLKEYTLSVLSGSPSLYKPETLRVDLQLVENVYQNSGYINVQIGEPVVEINREAGGIGITIPITREGEQFKVGKGVRLSKGGSPGSDITTS
jgi:outer membrane protein insertion porin family